MSDSKNEMKEEITGLISLLVDLRDSYQNVCDYLDENCVNLQYHEHFEVMYEYFEKGWVSMSDGWIIADEIMEAENV